MRTWLDEIMSISAPLLNGEHILSEVEAVRTPAEVQTLQRSLNELLSLQLGVDGNLGAPNAQSESRTAIRIFQQLARLPVTGTADATTVGRLQAALARVRPLGSSRRFVFDKFDLNEYKIKQWHVDQLYRMKTVFKNLLLQRKVDTILMLGHTDKTGSDQHNRKLSEERSKELGRHLYVIWKCRETLPFEKVYPGSIGLGEKHPLPGAGPAENRRVEAVFLKMNP